MEISREITRANLLHKILNRTSSESALQCSAGCFYKIISQIKNSGTCGHELLHKVKTSELILSLFFVTIFSLTYIVVIFDVWIRFLHCGFIFKHSNTALLHILLYMTILHCFVILYMLPFTVLLDKLWAKITQGLDFQSIFHLIQE